jgi:hypothetical protein
MLSVNMMSTWTLEVGSMFEVWPTILGEGTIDLLTKFSLFSLLAFYYKSGKIRIA